VLWGAFSGLGQFIIGQLYGKGETDGGMEGWMDGGRGEERKGDQRVCVVYIGLSAANTSFHVTSCHVM
jgi:hypothetical protein